ncbi:MAG: hypothetical protein FWB96_03065 [Defluviitaleaceae bacterium]|nr:hypothetical protein [Defluviitaleaceae bacterium]MCL2261884.1 hypothetical protein [Defluviitaleaceae bacterium]
MEWERAKNIILVAFILLNLGLAGLLFMEHNRYTLTTDRISTIHTVLSENNINLYTAPMRRFAPMRHLELSGFYYDIPALLEIFFYGAENVIQEETEERHYRFKTDYSLLEISNGFIFFDNSLGLCESRNSFYEQISQADAVKISDEFIETHFPDFVREIVLDAYGGDGVQVVYRQKYRGQIILSNEIEFLITAHGIQWVELQFGRVIGHSAESRMIFAPDEILITFMQRMRHRAMENPIFITGMDMVYLIEYASDHAGQVYPAVPFYRIFIMGDDSEFLINAYTNAASF